MEKPIAAFLQAGAAYMFFAAGAYGGDATLLIAPAIVSGVAGLVLWGRAARQSERLLSGPAQPDARGAQVQEAIVSLQNDLSQLREDRDFMRELYADGAAARTQAER